MKIGNVTLSSDVFLGPMAGVTDLAFRKICMDFDCGLMVTEMVSSKALHYNDKKTAQLLELDPEEVAAIQIFGSEPEIMGEAAERLNPYSNVILDINMGCPAPKIIKNGDGSALMKQPKLAGQIIEAVVERSIKPVTVKIRKGWDDTSINAVEIARIAEASGAAAVVVHGRTRDQFYAGKADYEIIKRVKQALSIPVIGNGDILSIEDAIRMKAVTDCDGIMIARGAQGNPWLIREVATYLKTGQRIEAPTFNEKIDVALNHFDLLIAIKGEHIGLLEMRKHAAWYIKGMQGASKVKSEINRSKEVEEVRQLLKSLVE
ncbi:MAG: tRNA dihydrouridine synthase DusB [Clostridia bacterium]|nr:tRNA dihydrouridine synthase DusB [Clostridia bacterium]